MVAIRIAVPALSEHVKATHISRATISVPVNGVHSPVMMQIANNALRICVNIVAAVGVSEKSTLPSWSRACPRPIAGLTVHTLANHKQTS